MGIKNAAVPNSHARGAGFDTRRYLNTQTKIIRNILRKPGEKLYIEFGGKIVQDKHAARVLPGYDEDVKLKLIKKLCAHGETIFVVSAKDILRGRIRGDFKITYDQEALRTLKELLLKGIKVKHVALTLLEPAEKAPIRITRFARSLTKMGFLPHFFFAHDIYPSKRFNVAELKNDPFIKTGKRIVMIMSPGGGSGKFGVCLSQLYHEMSRGVKPRYLKFETFPVHNLPVNHPVNLAYMAASADFYDVVMKDKRHGRAISYNRDLENYELLRRLAKIFPRNGVYIRKLSSATGMGANAISSGIINDELVQKEAAAEIARRLIRYKFEVARGQERPAVLRRARNVLRML
jgi:uncharacterized protein (UPF0371 family)